MDNRNGKVGYVCILKNIHTKEVEYVPACSLVIFGEKFTVQDLIEEFNDMKDKLETANKSISSIKKNVVSLIELSKLSSEQILTLKEEI